MKIQSRPTSSTRRSSKQTSDTEGSTISTAVPSTDGVQGSEKSSDEKTDDDQRLSEAESASLGSTGSIRDDKAPLV